MPDRCQQIARQGQHLGVNFRPRRAERLDAYLMELPVAALLRPLVAEDRAEVIELEHPALRQQIMLDDRAHRRRGALRAQREQITAAALEGIHLLGDDIGLFSDPAREQIRCFEDRRANLAVAVARAATGETSLPATASAASSGKISGVPRGALNGILSLMAEAMLLIYPDCATPYILLFNLKEAYSV